MISTLNLQDRISIKNGYCSEHHRKLLESLNNNLKFLKNKEKPSLSLWKLNKRNSKRPSTILPSLYKDSMLSMTLTNLKISLSMSNQSTSVSKIASKFLESSTNVSSWSARNKRTTQDFNRWPKTSSPTLTFG